MNRTNINSQHQANVGANEIWGIDFFWIKDLKCDEQEIKKVTEQIMHPQENANQEVFKKEVQ